MSNKILLLSLLLPLLLANCTLQKDLPAPYQPAKLTYLALGDSYTIGQSVGEKDRYPVQLADRLRVDSIDIEKARLVYRARVRTENVTGQVFLEMWCRFPGKGEYFSRALDQALSGTVGWTTLEAPFILQAGQTPDLVQLNVVVDGTGTVWVDDIDLVREDL